MNREAVYEQLKIDEGVVYEIYLDHLGYKTFGVGHLVLESDPEHAYEVGEPVSVERVIECFNRDLDVAVSCRSIPVTLTRWLLRSSATASMMVRRHWTRHRCSPLVPLGLLTDTGAHAQASPAKRTPSPSRRRIRTATDA